MGLINRFLFAALASALAWCGSWVYRFPDRFMKLFYGDLEFWTKPPVRFFRGVGLLWFVVPVFAGFRVFVPDSAVAAHAPIVFVVDIAFTICSGVLLARTVRQRT